MPRKSKPQGVSLPKRPYVKAEGFGELFSQIPNSIMRSHLTDAAKLTWGRLAQYQNKEDGRTCPKIATLADQLGNSRPKVERSLRELRKYGYLKSTRQVNGPSFYHLYFDVIPSKVEGLDPSNPTGEDPSKMMYIKDHDSKDHCKKNDIDYLPANRCRDPQAEPLESCLAQYFGKTPTARTVQEVRDGAKRGNLADVSHGSHGEIIEVLNSLKKIYPRGSKTGLISGNGFRWRWRIALGP